MSDFFRIHVPKIIKVGFVGHSADAQIHPLWCVAFFRLSSVSFCRQSAVCKDVHLSSSSSSEEDKPIKFSTSDASRHHAFDTFFQESNAPWYQGYCLSVSMAVFLLYFCVLREENDVDEELGKSIWQRIPTLKEQTLLSEIKAGKTAGTDVSELEKELDELYKKYK